MWSCLGWTYFICFKIGGDESTAKFTRWGSGFPKGGVNNNCAALQVGDQKSATNAQGFWADVACETTKYKAICEKPRAVPTTSTVTASTADTSETTTAKDETTTGSDGTTTSNDDPTTSPEPIYLQFQFPSNNNTYLKLRFPE